MKSAPLVLAGPGLHLEGRSELPQLNIRLLPWLLALLGLAIPLFGSGFILFLLAWEGGW